MSQPPRDPYGQQGQEPYPSEQYGPSGPQPPAGWYPDPGGQQVRRWWDGTQWAPHTQPMPDEPAAAVPLAAGPVPAGQRQPAGHRSPRGGSNSHWVRNILAGIGAVVVASFVISHISSGGSTSGSSAADTASAPGGSSPSSPPTCASQIAAWRNDGGTSQLEAVGNDMDALGKADTALGTVLGAGEDASSQEAALQAAASSVQADSQTSNANLPPSCIPHFRSDLRAAVTDADKAGIDSAQAVSEMGSSNDDVATADILAAGKAEDAANVKLSAALADINAYNNG